MVAGINANGQVLQAITFARAQIGKPYVWATAGPNAYDCSGLVYAAFSHAGYAFHGRPTTYTLIGMGTPVTRSQLQPGDLVFPDAGHVQIYTGHGNIIEAPHTGAYVIERKEWGPYWRMCRLIQNTVTDAGGADGTNPNVAPPNGSSTDSQLAAIQALAETAGKPDTWVRLLQIVAGAVLILAGMGRMAAGDITSTITGALSA